MNEEDKNIRVKKLILDSAKMIVNDKCGLDDEELFEAAMLLCHRKLYSAQIQNIYHMSERTLRRRVEEGKMPQWHHEPSGKKYMWQDEIERFLLNVGNKKIV